MDCVVGEYFKEWRRKVGVLTLVLACIFAGAWIRGFTIEDVVRMGDGQRIVTRGRILQTLSTSARNGFVWTREDTDSDITWLAGRQSHPVGESHSFDPKENVIDTGVMDWRWQFCGFDFGKYRGDPPDTLFYLQISHWSVVVPLTLISALLFLTKSRPSIRAKSTSPVLNEKP